MNHSSLYGLYELNIEYEFKFPLALVFHTLLAPLCWNVIANICKVHSMCIRVSWTQWWPKVRNAHFKTIAPQKRSWLQALSLAFCCVLYLFISIVSPRGHVFCPQKQFSNCLSVSIRICDMTIKNSLWSNVRKPFDYAFSKKIKDRNLIKYISCLICPFLYIFLHQFILILIPETIF